MRACFLIPIYDQGGTIRDVVKSLEPYALACVVVDDGSGQQTSAALRSLEAEFDFVTVERLPENGGKGAALSRGLDIAAERGFSHAVTLDADGQHDTGDVPRFLDASRAQPEALILGEPVFDANVPKARRFGRQISCFLARVETLSGAIRDPLCGFRSIPIEAARSVLASHRVGQRMDFDPELAVRMVSAGTTVVNLPTLVRYPVGGISHFHLIDDNLRISWLHTRLLVEMLVGLPRRLLARMDPRG